MELNFYLTGFIEHAFQYIQTNILTFRYKMVAAGPISAIVFFKKASTGDECFEKSFYLEPNKKRNRNLHMID